MRVALHILNPNEKNIILASEGSSSDDGTIAYVENDNFNVNEVLFAIGKIKLVGIIDSDKLSETKIVDPINILTNKNKATVVKISENPVACEIFYPVQEIGTKYSESNYEYTYVDFSKRGYRGFIKLAMPVR